MFPVWQYSCLFSCLYSRYVPFRFKFGSLTFGFALCFNIAFGALSRSRPPLPIPQFYRIRTPLQAPKMLIVADTAAPFLPAPLDDLLVYAADADARALFEAALDMIPRVFGATKVHLPAAAAAAAAGSKEISGILRATQCP
jgi:hypothetical protein